jgi:hypothetical protein
MHENSVPAPDITENVSCRKTKNILLFMKKIMFHVMLYHKYRGIFYGKNLEFLRRQKI